MQGPKTTAGRRFVSSSCTCRSPPDGFETSAEELKASNEEVQDINEELRSATEELETSKEPHRSPQNLYAAARNTGPSLGRGSRPPFDALSSPAR